jgi:hypothetical protein
MLDIGVSPSAFVALRLRMNQQRFEDEDEYEDERISCPRPSSDAKKGDASFCRQTAQKYRLFGFAPLSLFTANCWMQDAWSGKYFDRETARNRCAACEILQSSLPSSRTLMTERNGWLNLFLPPARFAC